VEVVPSPKFHSHPVILPVDVSVNWTVADTELEATGAGVEAGLIVTEAKAVLLPEVACIALE
jgi:hypothetical protein